MAISAISFTSNQDYKRKTKENYQEEVAVGAGGVAAGSGSIAKMYGKVQKTVQTANNASKLATQTVAKSKGLWATFKLNTAKFTADIAGRLAKLQNVKFIGPIIKSPVTKYLSTTIGGGLAFFALATGVLKMINDGSQAVGDLKNKIDEYSEAA